MSDSAEVIDRAIERLAPHGTFRGDRALSVAFLLRFRDWRPLDAPWWHGKEVCIIGADLDGNFFLRHSGGGISYWNHRTQHDVVIAPSVKDFVRCIV